MKKPLAELLLRRKELATKVAQLERVRADALFEVRAERVKVTESLDDIVARVPKLTASQVTEEFDFYASQLRRVDALIQRTNWSVEVESDSDMFASFSDRSAAKNAE